MVQNKKLKKKKLKKKEERKDSCRLASEKCHRCLCRLGYYYYRKGLRFIHIIPTTKSQHIFYLLIVVLLTSISVPTLLTIFLKKMKIEGMFRFWVFTLVIILITILCCFFLLNKKILKSSYVKKCSYCFGLTHFYTNDHGYKRDFILVSPLQSIFYDIKFITLSIVAFLVFFLGQDNSLFEKVLTFLFIIISVIMTFVYENMKGSLCQDIEDI